MGRCGLPLSMADQHVAGSARDGHSRRRPHRRLRRDVRAGPHLTGGTPLASGGPTRPKGRGTAAVACHQHRPCGADGAGHRERDGQRAALPRAAERHGHNHSRRCARPGPGSADGERRCAGQPAGLRERQRELGIDPRVAGASREPARRGGHESREARPWPLPHRTRAGVGHVEDAVALARWRDVGRGTHLSRGRPGYRREGRFRPRRR